MTTLKNTPWTFMAKFLNYFSMRRLQTLGGNKLPEKQMGDLDLSLGRQVRPVRKGTT